MPRDVEHTSPMRLLVVEATLTVLVFLEWPIRMGEVLEWCRVCLTMPSAILFLDCAPSRSASSRDTAIFCCRAARLDNCINWDSWLEELAVPWRLLPSLSLSVGVKTRSASLDAELELVVWKSLLESWRRWLWLLDTACDWELMTCPRDVAGLLACCDMSGMLSRTGQWGMGGGARRRRRRKGGREGVKESCPSQSVSQSVRQRH